MSRAMSRTSARAAGSVPAEYEAITDMTAAGYTFDILSS